MVNIRTLQKATITSLLRSVVVGIDFNCGGSKEDRHGILFLNSIIICIVCFMLSVLSDGVSASKNPSSSSFTIHIPNRILVPTLPHVLHGDHVPHSVYNSTLCSGTICGGRLWSPFGAVDGLTWWPKMCINPGYDHFIYLTYFLIKKKISLLSVSLLLKWGIWNQKRWTLQCPINIQCSMWRDAWWL
jgi:hypothetical protein